MGEKTPTNQKGVFEIGCSSGCGGGKHIYYYPEKNIVVAWSTGQDRSFVLPENKTADTEIIESFKFVK